MLLESCQAVGISAAVDTISFYFAHLIFVLVSKFANIHEGNEGVLLTARREKQSQQM